VAPVTRIRGVSGELVPCTTKSEVPEEGVEAASLAREELGRDYATVVRLGEHEIELHQQALEVLNARGLRLERLENCTDVHSLGVLRVHGTELTGCALCVHPVPSVTTPSEILGGSPA
jgi:hypothetical protein